MCKSIAEGGARCSGRHGISHRTARETITLLNELGPAKEPFPELNPKKGEETEQDFDLPDGQDNTDGPLSDDDLAVEDEEGDEEEHAQPWDKYTPEYLQNRVDELRKGLEEAYSPKTRKLAEEAEDPDVLTLLAEAEDEGVREAVQNNPNTPEEVIESLPEIEADDTRWERLRSVKNASEAELDELAEDRSPLVRMAVAASDETSPETSDRMAKDKNPFVRAWVGVFGKPSRETVNELKMDRNPLVKFAVRSRESLHQKTMRSEREKFSDVPDKTLKQLNRMAVGRNTKKEVLRDIVLFEKDPELLAKVASHPNTPNYSLTDLSTSTRNAEVLGAIARNGNASPRTLARLRKHRKSSIKAGVAANPNTPHSVLKELSASPSPKVRAGVVANSNFTTSPEHLAENVKDRAWQVRNAVAQNRNTSSESLSTLTRDRDDRVRLSVASSPRTSSKDLHRLSTDKRFDVRTAAMNELNRRSEAKERNRRRR